MLASSWRRRNCRVVSLVVFGTALVHRVDGFTPSRAPRHLDGHDRRTAPLFSPASSNSMRDLWRNPADVVSAKHRCAASSCRIVRRQSQTAADDMLDEAESWEWTRRVVGGLASVGVLETTYLTTQKIFGGGLAACSSAECSSVLTGPYSSIGGVPVSALGLFAYMTVACLCAAPTVFEDKAVEQRTRIPLVVATASMATFSVWLVALLVLKLQAFCAFCFASAALSWSNFALTSRAAATQKHASVATASGMFASTVAALLTLYFVETGIALDQARQVAAVFSTTPAVTSNQPAEAPLVFSPPKVDTISTDRALRLAAHLEFKGAKMYGAYWCSHCFAQKQAFGATVRFD